MTNEKREAQIALVLDLDTFLPDGPCPREDAETIVDALAVFEKALGEATVTPTDAPNRDTPSNSEREALTKQFADRIFWAGLRAPDSTKAVIIFKEIAAGFRRSVVTEPSAEPTCEHGTSLTELCEHVERLVNEPQGECPKCGVKVTDQTASTFYTHHDETCGGPLEEPSAEPTKNTRYRWAGGKPPSEDRKRQGEPSDAQVQAFEDEWYRLDGVTEPERHRRALRAALRAAGVTS